MKKSIFFYKELTPAEVGNTGTHEIYVRLPNNFDYKSFFNDSAIENGSVLEVNFSAQDITDGANSIVPLRFVYFHNSNGEKRIPSLGSLFQKHNVQAGDIVCLESRIEEGNTTYFIRFHKKGEIQVNPNSIYFSCINDEYNRRIERATIDLPLQQIFYGAPGTSKSHEVKKQTAEAEKQGRVFRTTFHPDSDYSTFVGCYKPTKETSNVLSLHKLHELYPEFKKMVDNRPLHRFIAKYYNSFKLLTEKEAESVFDNIETASTVTAEVPKLMAAIEELKSAASISYSFVPQAFTRAYVKAWQTDEPVFLIIEEINRGNCAQIFGDLFQLLDRNDDGYSCYPIDADTDLCQHLENELGKESEGIKNGKLRLPSNLHIWATTNTSDQSLFPIDSAFKRRWEWVYRPIGYKNSNWTIEIGDKKYNWVDFQRAINQKIYDVDNSEDKQLGDYFVNADRTGFKISADTLLNKILFYIWNDVCKDDPDQIFRCKTDKEEECVKFSDFFDDKIKKLQGFMAFIGVAPYGENKENKQEMPLDTETTETTDTPKE